LFAHLLESGHEFVPLPHDYYWSIPKEALYNPYSQPSELTLGQLSDDLEELKRIDNGKAEPLSFALVWLAAVIRAIGEETVA
jgi:hypothetical protein